MTSATSPVIAIFGAGTGLGASAARRFGREGYRVALVARRVEPLESLALQLAGEGIEAVPFPEDLARTDRIPELVKAITARLGRIDVVQYAPITGASPFVPAAELSPQLLETYMNVFLYSPVAVVQATLPSMLARGAGAILVGQGGSAARPVPGLSGIGPVMSATRNYLHSLHGEVAEQGVFVGMITVSSVILGSTGAAAVDDQAIAAGAIPSVGPDTLADLLWDMTAARDRAEVFWPRDESHGQASDAD